VVDDELLEVLVLWKELDVDDAVDVDVSVDVGVREDVEGEVDWADDDVDEKFTVADVDEDVQNEVDVVEWEDGNPLREVVLSGSCVKFETATLDVEFGGNPVVSGCGSVLFSSEAGFSSGAVLVTMLVGLVTLVVVTFETSPVSSVDVATTLVLSLTGLAVGSIESKVVVTADGNDSKLESEGCASGVVLGVSSVACGSHRETLRVKLRWMSSMHLHMDPT